MLQQGFEQGLEKGQRAMLLSLLAWRFGPLSAQVTARVASAGVEDLERWARRVVEASRLDDVFSG